MSSHGAIIANIIIALWFCKKKGVRFYDLADIAVIPFALGAMFIRIGNFINQELVGKVTDSIFGYKFDDYPELRHPVQLYQAFSNFIIFAILYFYRKLPAGYVFWMFILLFSIFRFIMDSFKDLPFYAGLTLAQYLSIPIFIISVVCLIRLKRR